MSATAWGHSRICPCAECTRAREAELRSLVKALASRLDTWADSKDDVDLVALLQRAREVAP